MRMRGETVISAARAQQGPCIARVSDGRQRETIIPRTRASRRLRFRVDRSRGLAQLPEMLTSRTARALDAYATFVNTPLTSSLTDHATRDPLPHLLDLLARTAREVPAYGDFLRRRGVDPSSVRTLADFQQLPLCTKADYIQAYPLAERCRGGTLTDCDMIAVSSGSTGEPTVWPRFLSDELAITARFEQIFHDSFEADRHSTLAVVCFPLGTWVGGMFTASCCRHLATKGYPITVVTPGNNKPEILRAVRTLGASFDQVVLLGYPPFVKEVVDLGSSEGLRWDDYRIKLVLAGEVFSEDWRTLMAERAGMKRPLRDTAALYGTADAGVLGNETPISIAIRRFLASRPEALRSLFGESRLPTLVQYDPLQRYFEVHQGTLLFSGDNGVPLVRYHISDDGGVWPYADLIARLHALGFDAEAEVRKETERGLYPLPFVYVFGRSHFAVSYYGANVFPETVSVALEQPETSPWVTGKFVLEVVEDEQRDKQLCVAVELSPRGVAEAESFSPERVADAVLAALLRASSEFAHYVPAHKQRPRVTLYPPGHPAYFPAGVKHRYSRK
jgi:phenylacetate-CoA ligase